MALFAYVWRCLFGRSRSSAKKRRSLKLQWNGRSNVVEFIDVYKKKPLVSKGISFFATRNGDDTFINSIWLEKQLCLMFFTATFSINFYHFISFIVFQMNVYNMLLA